MKPKYCYIFRGLPGSGKSYLAEKLRVLLDATIVSADLFFGRYNGGKYDASQLCLAHAYCMTDFSLALRRGQAVIVDNTGSRIWEYNKYAQMATAYGYEVRIIEMVHESFEDLVRFHQRNQHDVSWPKMLTMAMRWQEDFRALIIRGSDINVSHRR